MRYKNLLPPQQDLALLTFTSIVQQWIVSHTTPEYKQLVISQYSISSLAYSFYKWKFGAIIVRKFYKSLKINWIENEKNVSREAADECIYEKEFFTVLSTVIRNRWLLLGLRNMISFIMLEIFGCQIETKAVTCTINMSHKNA